MNAQVLARLSRLAFWAAAAFALVMALIPQPVYIPGDPGDKVLHMLAFATLAMLALIGWPRGSLLRIWLGLVAFGAGIEVLQAIPALNRDAQWLDLLADAGAAGAVLLAGAAWRRLRAR